MIVSGFTTLPRVFDIFSPSSPRMRPWWKSQLEERFRPSATTAEVEQDLVPESGVEQVQHRVLGAADVEVHARGRARIGGAHPVRFLGASDERGPRSRASR
jgi:hypothetical protein